MLAHPAAKVTERGAQTGAGYNVRCRRGVVVCIGVSGFVTLGCGVGRLRGREVDGGCGLGAAGV